MTKWKHPPVIKIYEALGAVSDKRLDISATSAKVYSSSGNKFYDVIYDPEKQEIMANDNGSYWKGYLGYPSIAYLMATGVLSYENSLGSLLRGVAWKDINQKFNNDFDKTLQSILSAKTEEEIRDLEDFTAKVDGEIKKLRLRLLGKKVLPPSGY